MKPLETSILTLTDSYKFSHWKQYPPGTQFIESYFESREGAKYPTTTFFGLQYLLQAYLAGQVVTKEKIDEAEQEAREHFGSDALFNRAGWEYILDKHNGKLPVLIKAVPEGTEVPTGNVLMTIVNTDPECYWLTNYLETLLVQVWYPCTVATRSKYMKRIILDALVKSGTPEEIDYKLHDFGFRGVSSVETAALGGAAHLTQFKGTDTFVGLKLLKQYYNGGIAGNSIPAAEHSTITSWGQEFELEAYRNMLQQYPTGLVAVVSDSYDLFNAISNIWGGPLKEEVLARDGCLVIRPDSGDPLETVPAAIAAAGNAFGGTLNRKNYGVLNGKVRIIQGDGIDDDTIGPILDAVMEHELSADNLAFGSGGGLLQKLNRDTQRFAFKCCQATVNGVPRDVFKQPKTDLSKRSKAGSLKLVKFSDGFHTLRANEPGTDLLVPVFKDGVVLVNHTLEDIRKRTKI